LEEGWRGKVALFAVSIRSAEGVGV
jgi:hypothetical protein